MEIGIFLPRGGEDSNGRKATYPQGKSLQKYAKSVQGTKLCVFMEKQTQILVVLLIFQ